MTEPLLRTDDALTRYLEIGWPVLPLKPGSKVPATANGFHDATTDPEEVRSIFASDGNVGLAIPRGFVVIDVDGDEARQTLKALEFDLPATATQKTPRGWHYVFRTPGINLPQRAGFLPGVDTRSGGQGYIVTEPSVVGGSLYEWTTPLTDNNIADCPDWLYEELAKEPDKVSTRPKGAGDGPIGRYNSEHSVEELLERHGYQRVGRRYLAPGSESGVPGVVLLDEGRCYSWHGEDHDDLANGHSHDAFSVYTELEHGGDMKAAVAAVSKAAPTVDEPINPPSSSWPEMAPEAYQGPIGEMVHLIEPHSEADPNAILIQGLVAFGSLVGRGPHFRVEADEHHCNLFGVAAGETSSGRKGTSLGQVMRIMELVDGDWRKNRVISGGLSSGEGLIWAVRDPITKTVKGTEETVDAGEPDKRLLVAESEFAQALKVMARQGNTISPVIRNAWDSGRLQALTKNSPARATGAHISIVGHITKQELLRHLGETEAGNGFGNRFLWFLVRRSKELPWGGKLHTENLNPLVHKLRNAAAKARTRQLIEPDADARKMWEEVYGALSSGKPGLLGAMIARAEAQTMRLALVYALADSSPEIRAEHLAAALAVWDYCETSARYIFGDALGDPDADKILDALRASPEGRMDRTELRELFSRNRSSAEIDRALGVLKAANLASGEFVKTPGPGRPTEVWTLTAFTAFTASPGGA